MAIAEDLSAFLADFGVPCTAGATSFTGLLNQPGEVIDFDRGLALSNEYTLTFITAQVTLQRNQAITVDGTPFSVRNAPRMKDDGAFSMVELTKV
jgi:hypothetical protein